MHGMLVVVQMRRVTQANLELILAIRLAAVELARAAELADAQAQTTAE